MSSVSLTPLVRERMHSVDTLEIRSQISVQMECRLAVKLSASFGKGVSTGLDIVVGVTTGLEIRLGVTMGLK